MAKDFKLVMFFGVGKSGWTETIYYKATTDLLFDAYLAASSLAAARLKLLGTEVTLEATRVSELGNPNNSLLTPFILGGGTSGLPAGNPWVGALCSLTAVDLFSNVYRRNMILRGLPAAWQTYNAPEPLNPNANPAFTGAINTYMRKLALARSDGAFSLKVTPRGAATPRYKVTLVELVNPGEFFKITVDPSIPSPPWGVGQKIHVRGARGFGTKGLNADAYIKQITAPGVYVLTSRQKCVTGVVGLTTVAQVYARGNVTIPIEKGIFERLVNKKTGRPFFGTRGRASSPSC